MQFRRIVSMVCLLLAAVPALAADDTCNIQAQALVQRLLEEMPGKFDAAESEQVRQAAVEVCEVSVQEIENRWFTEVPDKKGNARLKSKSH